jgi:hypothetical protein
MESSPMEELIEEWTHQREEKIKRGQLIMIGLLEGYTNTATVKSGIKRLF